MGFGGARADGADVPEVCGVEGSVWEGVEEEAAGFEGEWGAEELAVAAWVHFAHFLLCRG